MSMQKRICEISIILSIVLLISACSVTDINKTSRSSDVTPDRVEMQVGLEDYQFLGETKVSAKYKRYFGIFKMMIQLMESQPKQE